MQMDATVTGDPKAKLLLAIRIKSVSQGADRLEKSQ